jgi:uncharacterized protein YdhG (YjbR/CyaY superfamily)
MQNYKDIDEYISNFPADVRANLQKLRQTIQKAAPKAKEKISYGIPTFTYHGNLVHFAAYETHYGFYPGAAAIVKFKDELTAYETSKGTIRFPMGKPLPLKLISSITGYCVLNKDYKAK